MMKREETKVENRNTKKEKWEGRKKKNLEKGGRDKKYEERNSREEKKKRRGHVEETAQRRKDGDGKEKEVGWRSCDPHLQGLGLPVSQLVQVVRRQVCPPHHQVQRRADLLQLDPRRPTARLLQQRPAATPPVSTAAISSGASTAALHGDLPTCSYAGRSSRPRR